MVEIAGDQPALRLSLLQSLPPTNGPSSERTHHQCGERRRHDVDSLYVCLRRREGGADPVLRNTCRGNPEPEYQYICDRTRNGANRHGAKRIGIRSGAQMAALVWKT